jgi:hypothetical protein
MPMSFSSTDTMHKRNPPHMLAHPVRSFWHSHDSRRRMRSSSRTGVPKVRRPSPSRRGSISNLQGGRVLPHRQALPYLPPSMIPLPRYATSITTTSVTAWRKRRACGPGADFGRQGTTAATGAAHSPRRSCDNYPGAPVFQNLRARAASHTQGTTPVTTRTAQRSRRNRATDRAARRMGRRRRRRGGNKSGSSSNSNSNNNNNNSLSLNARMTSARKTPSSRA